MKDKIPYQNPDNILPMASWKSQLKARELNMHLAPPFLESQIEVSGLSP